jgi:DNA-binding transcriptional ArsR family regulator
MMMYAAGYYELKAKMVAALAHPVRLQVLDMLSEGEASTGLLVAALSLPQPLVSQHLAVLRSVGVVVRRREGTRQFYALSDPSIATACALMGEIVGRMARRESERLAPLAAQAR